MTVIKRLVVLFCVLGSSPLWSGFVMAQPPGETKFFDLVGAAHTVVVATCNTTESQWNYDHSIIFTKYSFTVEQVVKGDKALQTFDLRHLGGQTDDGQAMYVSHAPQFTIGKPYVLFLSAPMKTSALINKEEHVSGDWRQPRTMARATQGLFALTKDEKTGKTYVVNPPREFAPKASKGYAQSLAELNTEKRQQQPSSARLFLDDFVARIEQVIQEGTSK